MNTQITVFSNPEFGNLRTIVDKNANTWFVGKEVALMLGYAIPQKAISEHVEKEDCIVLTYKAFSKTEKADLWSGNDFSNKILINESGLYSLILSSKLPKAKEFKHWVTSEVLPSIRKDGGYMVAKPDDTDESIMARAIIIAQSTIERLKNEKQKLEVKANYLDEMIRRENCYTTTTVAKDHGLTAVELNRFLCEQKIQYRQSGQYNLYAEYARMGLGKYRTPENVDGEGKVHVFQPYLVWTEAGRAYLHQLIQEHYPQNNPNRSVVQLDLFCWNK